MSSVIKKEKKTTQIEVHSGRKSIVDYLERQLIGPAGGDEETLPDSVVPFKWYLMGCLFPIGSGQKKNNETEESGDSGASDELDNPISMAYQSYPSSMGLSFFTKSPVILVSVYGANYIRYDAIWKREPFATQNQSLEFELSSKITTFQNIGNTDLQLFSTWRKSGQGWLVSIVLSNKKVSNAEKIDAEDVYYQLGMKCKPMEGGIGSYPSPNRFSWDPEEDELAFVYRDKKTFGIGHAVSASWPLPIDGEVEFIETKYMPTYEVPDVSADFEQDHPLKSNEAFSLQYLANPNKSTVDKITQLKAFRDAYSDWIMNQSKIAADLSDYGSSPRVLISRMKFALERMDKGIKLLAKDKVVMECFRLSNEAMLMQMVHSDISKIPGNEEAIAPNYFSKNWAIKRWRPFQLAFQLMVLESLCNKNSTDRDIVDLIWFPTGGGKTEAYLSVAAFELFYRRLMFNDLGGGTAVIKRYTLRLLTTQQFERAASLICACEAIRSEAPEKYGEEAFTLGLWVGGSSTPNNFATQRGAIGAFEIFNELLQQEKPVNPFQFTKCPWCGTSIIPDNISHDRSKYGIHCDNSYFEFFCPNSNCRFHNLIPVNVVDEHLYQKPPSFLIATIDKFARLAWMDKPKAFFNGGDNGNRLPPSLVIQDELHLISGPLGTIAGIYEAAIDVIMQSVGSRPKYIAATATIRRSSEQVKRLYARDVAVFPPTGLTSSDSFFSREVPISTKSGRLYVGVMGQSSPPVFSLIQIASALAQAPMDVELSPQDKDGYWTQVIYHNSKRELGGTMKYCRDDIPARAAQISDSEDSLRQSFEPVEMSANVPSKEIPQTLNRLKMGIESENAIDILPCTNMFSVGVDVGRLGLMLINGQPKTTSEYIQASSRVGRDKVSGLVIAHYPGNRARDRSHYESFIPFHQALYRAVEPTSVTPYAMPAMERALHSALIIVMRYCAGLDTEAGASKFNPAEIKQAEVIEKLLNRMLLAQKGDDLLCDGIKKYLDKCIKAWKRTANSSGNNLKYNSARAHNFESLIVQYTPGTNWKPQTPWPTLNSMRDVDSECNIRVLGED